MGMGMVGVGAGCDEWRMQLPPMLIAQYMQHYSPPHTHSLMNDRLGELLVARQRQRVLADAVGDAQDGVELLGAAHVGQHDLGEAAGLAVGERLLGARVDADDAGVGVRRAILEAADLAARSASKAAAAFGSFSTWSW